MSVSVHDSIFIDGGKPRFMTANARWRRKRGDAGADAGAVGLSASFGRPFWCDRNGGVNSANTAHARHGDTAASRWLRLGVFQRFQTACLIRAFDARTDLLFAFQMYRQGMAALAEGTHVGTIRVQNQDSPRRQLVVAFVRLNHTAPKT